MAALKAGIVGGTGYTGVELLRLLLAHPEVQLRAITSRKEAGLAVSDLYANLRGHTDLRFTTPEQAPLRECDVVFFATPHGVAMQQARELLDAGVRIIDLAADFRLRDPATFERWYGMPHACPDLLEQAVYGLPELQRAAIRDARVVANPGCYPTTVQIGFAPLLRRGLVDAGHLIASCASGVSGAGRKAEIGYLFSEASDNFKAYGVAGHRHGPEIDQELRRLAGRDPGDASVHCLFQPHLVPMIRGMHSSLFARLNDAGQATDLQALFQQFYADEPFVDVMPAGSAPDTRSVRGANVLRLAVHRPQPDTVLVLVAQDNLTKGASGQAVQNMNLMFGLPETAGLQGIALMP
ncbi:MAG: N-acetyl-gamma-glutamyl-phosphate reductase [Betaproteobacteria bacterium]|nr:N-acetyl-gamma-glutamyl-phosphate reductase [Betaproteobacteria bacterium]